MGQAWSEAPASLEELETVFEKHFELIRPISHKLFDRFVVRPFGVLRTTDAKGSAPPKPGSPVEAVVVDCASREVLSLGKPSKAAGSSRDVYTWLGICGGSDSFPAEVRRKFPPISLRTPQAKSRASEGSQTRSRNSARQADAEAPPCHARYHRYGPGLHVIHTVGPVLRDLEQSIRDLTQAYAATFEQFCIAIGPPVEADGLPTASARAAFMTSSKASSGGYANAGNKPATNNASAQRDAPLTLRLQPLCVLENKRLVPYRGQIFWTSIAIALERLPLAMQRRLEEVTIELCAAGPEGVEVYESAQTKVRGGLQLDKQGGCISKHEGSYEWVRKKNGPADRMERLAASSMTMQAVYLGGYFLPNGRAVALRNVEAMAANTSIFRASSSSRPGGHHVTTVRYVPGTVMQVAVHLAQKGQMAVAVNAASAYHVGGGVLTGGRHALEESWCVTSTLLKSLQQAQYMSLCEKEAAESAASSSAAEGSAAAGSTAAGSAAEEDGFERYLPEDGVICSPLVEVFREGYTQGYAFLPEATVLAGVVSVAMYNRNPKVRDSPVDAPSDDLAYQQGVRRKLQSMIEGALSMGAEILVCPDVGCGVFENDPAIVGALFGDLLKTGSVSGRLTEVVLTGQKSFAEAVHDAYSGGEGNPLLEMVAGGEHSCSVA